MASNVLEWFARIKTSEGQKELERLAGSADTADKSLDRVEQRSQRVGRSANQLAGALSLVHPQAGEAARTVGDLADAMEVAGGSSRMLGVGLGPMAGIIAAVGAAVTIGIGLWKSYGEEAEIAARAAKMNADAHKGLKPLLDDAARSMVALQVATGELSEAEGQQRLRSAQSLATWSAATQAQRSRLNELRREQESVKTQIVDGLSAITFGPTALVLDGLTDSTADLQQEMNALQGSVTQSTEVLARTVTVGAQAAEVTQRQTQARRAQTAAVKEEIPVVDKLAAQWNYAKLELDALDMAGATAALEAFADEMSRAAQVGLDWEAALLRIADAQAAAATRAAYVAQIREGRATAGQGLLSLAGGDITGLAGALGGASQALSTRGVMRGMESGGAAGRGSALLGVGLGGLGAASLALGPLAAIGGAADPARAARQQAMALKDAVIGGIEALPEILVEVIPELVGALVTELPGAIARALGELLERLLAKIFPNLFGKGTLSSEQVAQAAQAAAGAAAMGGADAQSLSAQAAASAAAGNRSRLVAPRPSFLDLGGPGSTRGVGGRAVGGTTINQINTVTLDGLSGFNRENTRMYGAGGLRESV